jgi:hypothetical protein
MNGKFVLQEAQIALAREQKKTNADWYTFTMLGSYFKFEQGVLLQCPMNIDGSRDDTPCEVDWERLDPDDVRSLKAVAQVLAANP